MTITGIIAEFNPFHNGHKFLLDQLEGLKIVAMSGNFVQRGEPAIIDKWTRTQMALESGADLVVELPFLVAVQSADYFAQGAVDILDKLAGAPLPELDALRQQTITAPVLGTMGRDFHKASLGFREQLVQLAAAANHLALR